MEKGKIKRFLEDDGYGFIAPSEGGDDVFFHINNVKSPERLVEEGATVRYEYEKTDKGFNATRVLVQGEATPGSGGTTSSSKRSPKSSLGNHLRVPRDAAPFFTKRKKIENLSIYLHKGLKPDPEEGGFSSRDLPEDFPALDRLSNRYSYVLERVQQDYDALVEAQPTVTTRKLNRQLDWRMAIGLGRASVRETSMTLHHVYGIPYVPGSGVKGAMRSFVLLQCFWTDQHMELMNQSNDGSKAGEKLEEAGLADPLFCTLFGTPPEGAFEEARRGRVRFYDAYPSEPPVVERDIMNPHYRDYYMNADAPTDDQDPTPIYFLTVRETSFTFWLSQDTGATSLSDIPDYQQSPVYQSTPEDSRGSLLDIASHWLKRTLTEYGLGAKTSVGYGYFTS